MAQTQRQVESAQHDLETVKSELEEQSLLSRCRVVQTVATKEVSRFKEARYELSEILSYLDDSSSHTSKQVRLVTNFPHWAREAVGYLTEITSDVPQILQAIDGFDSDAMTARLAALTSNLPTW